VERGGQNRHNVNKKSSKSGSKFIPERATKSPSGRSGARQRSERATLGPRKIDDSSQNRPKLRKREPKPVHQATEPVTPFIAEDLPTFADLGLSAPILTAIGELGFETPTPIQAKAIPALLSGGDLIGQAQTGTGKTAAFALPMIERIDVSKPLTQALILAPTRELAVQVAGGIHDLGKHTGLRVVPVYGGQPIDRQFRSLRSGAHVVVGTPGRVLDHLRRGSLNLEHVAFCTLDEADEMMALGFAEDMDQILGLLPESRQLAFFSATMPPKVVDLSKKYLKDAVHVAIEASQRTLDTTNQTYYEVPRGKKLEALARVLDMESPGPTIVFCRTRQETMDLTEALRLRGYNADALHGEMSQNERDRVMKRFRDGQSDLLVATDVAARGLDIDTVTHVINYDIPWDVEQYIHRIGRTGRAGRTGDAITLVEGKQRRQLEVIERLIGAKIQPARIPTAADIAARRRDELVETVEQALREGEYADQMGTVATLAEQFDPVEIAAAALSLLWQAKHSVAEAPGEDFADFEQPEAGMKRLFVGMGRQDGLRPADLVATIAASAGLPGKAIGVIDILDRVAFVEVPEEHADRVIQQLSKARLRNRKVKVSMARPR